MSHADFLRDTKAVRDRGEWFAEFYLTNPSGIEEILRFSRRGMTTGDTAITVGSDTVPAHTPYKKRILTAPTVTQSLWQQGQILGNSIPSYGATVLRNADRGLDQYRPQAGYKWAGRRCKIFYFDIEDIQGTIAKVFDGQLGQPAYSMDTPVSVPLLGKEAKFNTQISKRVYRGTSYSLELVGARVVSYGTPAAVNITGSFTIEGWLWLDVLPSSGVTYWGWSGGATYPWQMIVRTSGALALQATIGGSPESKISTAALAIQKWYHFAWVVSGATVTYYLWNEDAQTLTEETLTPFTNATRQGNSGGTYVLQSAVLNPFMPWADEFRVWNVARTKAEIAADRHRPIPQTAIPTSLVHYTPFDDGGVSTTVTDLSSTAANGTISGAGSSTWLWALEGGPELAGTPKTDIWGKRRGVACTLVDPFRQIYQVAGGGSVQSIVSQEGGNPHIMDADASSVRSLVVTGPTVSGHSQTFLARGYFRLKDAPTLPISATVEGYNGGALGYVDTPATITRDIITRRGPLLADPGDLDTASFTTYASKTDPVIGHAFYSPVAIRDALDQVNRAAGGWWGYVGSSILFHVERFAGPAATADWNFSQSKIRNVEELPPEAVIYQVIVRYRKNDVRLSEDQVAAAIKGTAGWQEWTMEWQEKPATDWDLLEDYPGDESISLIVETGLYEDEDAQLLANYLLATLGGFRQGFKATLLPTGLETTISETETLTSQLQNGTEILGLDGTDKYIILSTQHDYQQGIAINVVWK